MRITQLTHHDLDGYGASTVVASRAAVARVVHVARYSDVGPVVAAELKRLAGATEPEMLLMTDLGLEPVAVSFIKDAVAMNGRRAAEGRHRLVVLDHHGLVARPIGRAGAGAGRGRSRLALARPEDHRDG